MNNKILIANTGEDSLTLIDLKNGFKTKTIFLSELIKENDEIQKNDHLGPFNMEQSKDGHIIITNSYDNSIIKIDLENIKLLKYIKVGRNPTVVRRFEEKIFVANTDSNSMSVLDDESFTLIEDISVGEKPTDIQIDKENSKLFVANGNCYTINVLDLNTEKMSSITIGTQPLKIIIEGEKIFVLSYINNGVTNFSNLSELGIENHQIKMSIDLRGIFDNIIKIKLNNIFYLSNVEDGYIYRVLTDKNINISKIYLGGMPSTMKWDGKNKIYITNIFNNELSVIDILTNQIITTLKVGKEPNGILLL